MSQKKIGNPIDIREHLQITYPTKSVRGAGVFQSIRYLKSHTRANMGIRVLWDKQGFRICLKRK